MSETFDDATDWDQVKQVAGAHAASVAKQVTDEYAAGVVNELTEELVPEAARQAALQAIAPQVIEVNAAKETAVTSAATSVTSAASAGQFSAVAQAAATGATTASEAASEAASLAGTYAAETQSAASVTGPLFDTYPEALAALASLDEAQVFYVVADPAPNARGQYVKRDGKARYISPSLPEIQRAVGAQIDELLAFGGNAGALSIYTGSASILPETVLSDGTTILEGWRPADGAKMFYGPLAGPGFASSVQVEAAPLLQSAAFTGTGIIPVFVMGLQTPLYYDPGVGRLVIHDVLVRGDHGLAGTYAPTPTAGLPTADRVRLMGSTGIAGLIPYGQSLSVGAQGLPVLSTSQPYGNLTFAGGTKSSSTADKSAFGPLVESALGENNATGTSRGETPASAAANYAVALAALEAGYAITDLVLFASTPGQGGTAIAGLSKGSAPYTRLIGQVTSAKALATAAGKAFEVHAVPWLQGETDYDNSITRAAYLAAFLQLVTDLNADIKAITGQTAPVHLLTYQTAYRSVLRNGTVALAQLDAVRQSPLIHLVGPIYHLPYNADGTHSSNVGYNWFGHAIGRAYYQLAVEQRVPDCLMPVSATAVGTTLRIRFRVPQRPLALDVTTLAAATDYGLRVVDDGGVLALSGIAIVNGDTVQCTLSRSLAANPRARYGLDYLGSGLNISGGGSGNIRDSTATTVMVNGTSRPLYHAAPHFELAIASLAE